MAKNVIRMRAIGSVTLAHGGSGQPVTMITYELKL